MLDRPGGDGVGGRGGDAERAAEPGERLIGDEADTALRFDPSQPLEPAVGGERDDEAKVLVAPFGTVERGRGSGQFVAVRRDLLEFPGRSGRPFQVDEFVGRAVREARREGRFAERPLLGSPPGWLSADRHHSRWSGCPVHRPAGKRRSSVFSAGPFSIRSPGDRWAGLVAASFHPQLGEPRAVRLFAVRGLVGRGDDRPRICVSEGAGVCDAAVAARSRGGPPTGRGRRGAALVASSRA